MPWSRAEGRGEQEEESVGNRTAASGRWPPGLEELLRRSQDSCEPVLPRGTRRLAAIHQCM
jgi:hypothetical protein